MLLDHIEGSPTREMTNQIQKKVSSGEKVVSLAIGEPSFDTPPEIIECAHKSMLIGETHYTSSYGIPEVRKAISAKVKRKNRINAEVANTIFCTTKLAVYAVLTAIPADHYEVLVPDPGYFYSQPAQLSSVAPVTYRLKPDFSLDIDEVKRKATAKTRAILLNSPANPTGKVCTKGELEELYAFCNERGIFIVSDEAYEDLVYGKTHTSPGSLEDKPDKVISLFSLSKSYAMTGWRAGYIVANERIIQSVNKFLENMFTSFPPFIQKASAFALENCDNRIKEFAEELARRKKVVEEEISKSSSLTLNPIEGAFYAFPKYKASIPSREISMKLLEKHNVAVLAGSGFGSAGEGHLRISFAAPPDSISQGVSGLRHYLDGLA